jgi:hypothetical protein
MFLEAERGMWDIGLVREFFLLLEEQAKAA